MRLGRHSRAAAVLVTAAALAAPGTASAAQRLTTIETPSVNVNPADVKFNGPVHRLRTNVLLPDGYDGRRRFPVLFLLHGAGGQVGDWARPTQGDVLNTARGLPAIVVMPEAATGFYTNWWNGGRRGAPGWERYFIDELVPLVQRRYRVLPGRANHAIAGLSMGGFGATFLASQLPGYFGSAASFSGLLQHQRPQVDPALQAFGARYTDVFGPQQGFYATGHNSTRLVANLRDTRLYVTVGDGTPEPGVQSSPGTLGLAGVAEAELRQEADEFVDAARRAGDDTTYRPLHGVHDWPYWRRHLRAAIAWGLFRPVAENPTSWSYRTVAQRGSAWGLAYRFAAPPDRVITLSRAGARLRGAGSGTVTLANAAGCGFTARLPFDHALPARICGRIAVKVSPRRVRRGHRVRLRFRVKRVVGGRRVALRGARIRVGRRVVRTNARGRAGLRYRPRGRLGVRRLKVAVRGLRTVRPRIRVVR
jgi:S-formylglutathione hydrolase FrmB